MNEVHQKYFSKGLKVIAVSLDSDQERLEKFLVKHPASFEVRFDPTASLAEEFEVSAMPQSYLLNSEGKVLYKHSGFNDEAPAQLEAKIIQYISGEH